MKKRDAKRERLREDIEFARRTEKAWQDYEQGKFITYTKEEFLKKLKSQ